MSYQKQVLPSPHDAWRTQGPPDEDHAESCPRPLEDNEWPADEQGIRDQLTASVFRLANIRPTRQKPKSTGEGRMSEWTVFFYG